MNRKTYDLRNGWKIAKDPENCGKREGWEHGACAEAVAAHVPSIIQQFFPEYHGVAWYWCTFTPELAIDAGEQLRLRFGGVDYKADVWLNGTYLGAAECPETPFSFDVSGLVRVGEENLLAVRVLNPTDQTVDGINLMNVPHRNKVLVKSAGSSLNHGGIWFDVTLTVLPSVYLEDVLLSGDIHSGRLTAKVETASKFAGITDAHLSVQVYTADLASDPIAAQTLAIGAENGGTYQTELTVPDHKLWDTDTPYLYRVVVRLTGAFGEHTRILRFGFREFCVKNGFFYLNNKKIFLKSAHSGNAFPIGQMFPVRPDHVQKDFLYAKAAGFNMLRAISGMFRPEQLELADEIGLLVYEECLAAWCLGYSHCEPWSTPEEYAQMCARHPDMPLGDEATMLARWRSATAAMIRRDRNHTSVVAWGFLNETLDNGVFRTAVDFLPEARLLDPTRLILLNSGRFERDHTIGSASNPYSPTWDHLWGSDGTGATENACAGDHHFYPRAPMDRDAVDFIRHLGQAAGKPVFFSEFGVGATFNVIEEWRHFQQYGEREDLEDCSWVREQSERLLADWERLGLSRVFPFAEAMLKESQRKNADERKRNFDIVRSNPNIAGFSLTGLLDHGMCGEGLWSYFRRWKPEMFDAVSEGWAPLRFCLFADEQVYRNREFTVEAVLANDGVLPTGEYTADLAVVGAEGTVWQKTVRFALSAEQFAVPIIRETLSLDVPEGEYRLVAAMREASPAATATKFWITDPSNHADLSAASVAVVGIPDAAAALLCERGATVQAWNGAPCKGLIVAGSTDEATLQALLRAAADGATVLLADAAELDAAKTEALRAVVPDLQINDWWDWLYHKEYVLADRTVFNGLGSGILELPRFGQTFAHRTFTTAQTPERILCPGFLTGYYAVPGAYAQCWAMAGFAYGQGRVVLNTFELCNHIGEPTADRLFTNLIAAFGAANL